MLAETLIPITFFLCAFGILYVYLTTRHREKMYLMENNLNPEDYKIARLYSGFGSLKIGMLAVGIALGLFMGNVLERTNILEEGLGIASMLFLFGGVSLIIHHFIEKKATQQ